MIDCTFYFPPNGRTEAGTISHISAEDEAWFKANNIKLSGEEISEDNYAMYADTGLKDEDGEPLEALELSFGRTCKDTMAALRVQTETLMKASAEVNGDA